MTFSRFGTIAVLAGITCLRVPCQTQTAFEAASIRRNSSGSSNTSINISGGRLTIGNASLKTLIRNAYQLLSFQLAGGPAWLDTEMYDIVATTGDQEKLTDERFRLLLKSLLAERFALQVHWEDREASLYALIAAKDGPKLKTGAPGQRPGINTEKGPGGGRMIGASQPVAILASNLGNQLGRFVIDKTGLEGVYDWTLEWDPDPNPDSTRPSLFTAVQEQLGLRLESQKGPVPMLVIDRAEKASDN